MERLSHSLAPLIAQLATILVASTVIVAIAFITTGITDRRIERAGNEAEAALVAGRIDANVHAVELVIDGLSDSRQLDLSTALDLHDALIAIDEGGRHLVALVDSPATREIHVLAAQGRKSLRSYFTTNSLDNLSSASTALDALAVQMEARVDEFDALADTDQAAVTTAGRRSQLAIMATCAMAALIIAVTTFLIGQSQRRALAKARSERDDLAALTSAIQKRNEQFAALYQVVAEITDNLSMRYVVNTAVSEAAKLVKADQVDIRLLENDALAPRGMIRDGEMASVSGVALPLGVGLAGKAAKRGRTIRVDSGAEALMVEDEKVEGIESGLIVPLIVGARVVGTLACWSKQINNFDSDDERVIELMASQVATAVAAADLHASSEQRASHDALTGLPNRRRLIEDTAGFQQSLDAGAAMAVAMFDIDHFKRFNDDFGHKVGDVTLQKVAEVMQGALRETDRLYRYGGEEFLLVLPDVGENEATRLVERVRRTVERTILTGENLEPVGPVTISAGVVLAPEAGHDLSMLIVLADEAMYRAKAAGRNRIVMAKGNAGMADAA